jgi:hypothetical protein
MAEALQAELEFGFADIAREYSRELDIPIIYIYILLE